jgi:hypothetical protein
VRRPRQSFTVDDNRPVPSAISRLRERVALSAPLAAQPSSSDQSSWRWRLPRRTFRFTGRGLAITAVILKITWDSFTLDLLERPAHNVGTTSQSA